MERYLFWCVEIVRKKGSKDYRNRKGENDQGQWWQKVGGEWSV